MGYIKKKDVTFIGLMLFALFFGAGNLIFPPFLGQEAGMNYWEAIAGFILTGVGLPVLGVIAIAISGSSVESIANKVGKRFAVLFTLILYLAIGPFFGVPRAMNVSFEMGVAPFIASSNTNLSLILFSSVFFIIVLIVSLNPAKLIDRIGNIISPVLLAAIALLVGGSLFTWPLSQEMAPENPYKSNPAAGGILEGYLTMDTIAALAFGLVIVTAIKNKGVTSKFQLIRSVSIAGVIAGIGLALVYISIGWIGVQTGAVENFENGSQILTFAADRTFGTTGALLLGIIVTLACFTTCVGLVTACGQYFDGVFSKLSYRTLVIITVFISFSVANLGLNTIISISAPVLIALYPIAIVLIVLTFVQMKWPIQPSHYRGAVIGTALVSIYDGLRELHIDSQLITEIFLQFPLFSAGLGWVLPAVFGFILGHTVDKWHEYKSFN